LRGRRPRRLALRISAAWLFAGCFTLAGCTDPSRDADPPLLEATPLHLFDHLDQVVFEGIAQRALRGLPEPTPRTLLRLDFEDGRIEPLAAFRGRATVARAGDTGVAIVEGPHAHADGRSLELRGDGRRPLSARTPPIAVSPLEIYELRYRVASEAVQAGRDAGSVAQASVLLYRLAPDEAERAAEALADPARERAARLPEPPSFWVPRRAGTEPWTEVQAHFDTGAQATHAVLSFDLGRAADDRGSYAARGRVRFDDIELSARREPIWARGTDWEVGMGAPHPLKRAIELEHFAAPTATERRYAIALPAPSALRFAARVPDGGSLSLGWGLPREARLPGAEPLTFSVDVRPEGGETETLLRRSLDPARMHGFEDAEIDLARFAEQRVWISLRAEGRPPPRDEVEAAQRLPEAGFSVSYPVLHSRKHRGRLVMLVAVDALPATGTSTYGYARDTTPNLTRIAADGVRFERALSPSPWTLPAVASIFTGLSPARHRAGDLLDGARSWRRGLAEDFATVAEQLRAAGFETRAWINNTNLTRRLGLHQGFATFVDYGTRSRRNAAEPGVRDALEALAAPRGTDRFVFFHLMDPHGPYRPDPAFLERFADPETAALLERQLDEGLFGRVAWGHVQPSERERAGLREFYDAVVAYADHQLGRLYDASRESNADLTFVVTADHGEEFWEHGGFEHGQSVYDELLRVPLVIVRPGHGKPGRVIGAPVSTQDLAATILALAGLEPLDDADSNSLLLVIDGAEPPTGRRFPSSHTLYGVERLGLEADGVKYIYNQATKAEPTPRAPPAAARHELYDLARDPLENDNRFRADRETGLALHEALASEFTRGLGGDYVVAFDAGDDARDAPPLLEGELLLPPGARWARFMKDFVWPMPDGRDAELETRVDPARGLRVASFRVRAPRAVLAFSAADPPTTPVRAWLRLDGQRVPLSWIELGASGAMPELGPIEIAADEDLFAPDELIARRARTQPRVRIGRVRPAPEVASQPAAWGLDGALRQELEALGYVE
jgi:arylsulfatase A-like enzyme